MRRVDAMAAPPPNPHRPGPPAVNWAVAIEGVTLAILSLTNVSPHCGRVMLPGPAISVHRAAPASATPVQPHHLLPPAPGQVTLWCHSLFHGAPAAFHFSQAALSASMLASVAFMARWPGIYLRRRNAFVFAARLATYTLPNSRTLSGAAQVLQRAASPGVRGFLTDGVRMLMGESCRRLSCPGGSRPLCGERSSSARA